MEEPIQNQFIKKNKTIFLGISIVIFLSSCSVNNEGILRKYLSQRYINKVDSLDLYLDKNVTYKIKENVSISGINVIESNIKNDGLLNTKYTLTDVKRVRNSEFIVTYRKENWLNSCLGFINKDIRCLYKFHEGKIILIDESIDEHNFDDSVIMKNYNNFLKWLEVEYGAKNKDSFSNLTLENKLKYFEIYCQEYEEKNNSN